MLRVTGQVCSFENLVTHLVFVTYASKSQKTNWFQQKRLIRVKMILKYRFSCDSTDSGLNFWGNFAWKSSQNRKNQKLNFRAKNFCGLNFSAQFLSFLARTFKWKMLQKCLNFHAKNNCNFHDFGRENSSKNASKMFEFSCLK